MASPPRYLVFIYSKYYPSGGSGDVICYSNDPDEVFETIANWVAVWNLGSVEVWDNDPEDGIWVSKLMWGIDLIEEGKYKDDFSYYPPEIVTFYMDTWKPLLCLIDD